MHYICMCLRHSQKNRSNPSELYDSCERLRPLQINVPMVTCKERNASRLNNKQRRRRKIRRIQTLRIMKTMTDQWHSSGHQTLIMRAALARPSRKKTEIQGSRLLLLRSGPMIMFSMTAVTMVIASDCHADEERIIIIIMVTMMTITAMKIMQC